MEYIFEQVFKGNVLVIGGILGLVIVVFFALSYIKNLAFQKKVAEDETKNYEETGVDCLFDNTNGDKIKIHYKVWEKNKQRYIKETFAPGKIINYDGVAYRILSSQDYYKKIPDYKNGDMVNSNSEMYALLSVELYREETPSIYNTGQFSMIENHGIMQGTSIVQTNEINELVKSIEELQRYELPSDLKVELDLVKLKLQYGEDIKENKASVIKKLGDVAKTAAPYASLAGAVLTLIMKIV